jgi:endonuclease-3
MAKTTRKQARDAQPARRARESAARSMTARRPAAPRPAARRTRETQAARHERALRILQALRGTYPEATTALRHGSAYELLVATILSAQCTDERVNRITPDVFRRYPDPAALAGAPADDLEALIKPAGFFRNKTQSLLGMARVVCDDFDGRIPDTMEALLRLPGVARKTANCVLGTWYRKNEGIVVDTHVGRLALRLCLLTTAKNDKDAVKIERDLMDLFPQDSWTHVAHALIEHGRRACTARQPKCGECGLAADCPSAGRIG